MTSTTTTRASVGGGEFAQDSAPDAEETDPGGDGRRRHGAVIGIISILSYVALCGWMVWTR